VPLGNSAAKLKIDALCDGVRAFFYGAKVELLPKVSSKKLLEQVQSRKSATGVQFETFGCQKLLTRLMPADAFVVIGITSDELYKDNFGFVYGEANAMRGTGVFSFAHCSIGDDRSAFRDSLKVLCHETGHLFGISHCIWWQCVMNGAAGDEVDHMPLHLCPIDLAKLQEALGFDVVERERAIEAMWTAHGLTAEARFSGQLIAKLTAVKMDKARASGAAHVTTGHRGRAQGGRGGRGCRGVIR